MNKNERTVTINEHNTRRSNLALGKPKTKDGVTMPKATDMFKLVGIGKVMSYPKILSAFSYHADFLAMEL